MLLVQRWMLTQIVFQMAAQLEGLARSFVVPSFLNAEDFEFVVHCMVSALPGISLPKEAT